MAISLLSNGGSGLPLNARAGQALEQVGSFQDIAALDKLRASAQKNEKEALRQVAQQFESIFMNMVLKGMRDANAAFESELGNSNYTKFYRDMSDQQMAMNLSQQGALGLADIMVEQLDPTHSALTPASVLRTASTPATHLTADSSSSRHRGVPLQAAINPEPEFKDPEDFVSKLLPLARQTAAALGVDPKALLAQAALETGWGKKVIQKPDGSSSFNLFNIKASGDWQGNKTKVSTLEFEQGLPVKKQAVFRAYESFQDSFNDYKKFLSNSSRYKASLESEGDSAGFLHELQKAGYATDPEYATKAISVLGRITGMLTP